MAITTAREYTSSYILNSPTAPGYLWSEGSSVTASNRWVTMAWEGTPMPTPSRGYKPSKRLMFWGKAKEATGKVLERKVKMGLDFLKKGLSDEQKEKYVALAEIAFKHACKSAELGMSNVAKQFEEKMNQYLKRAAIFTAGYNVFIDKDALDKFKEKLPNNRQLVVDPIDEYKKPLPVRIQTFLKQAQDAECFDSFWVFWLREVKDPILYGKIDEDKDRYYFIVEWGKDIKINDFIQSELKKEFDGLKGV